MSTFGQQLLLRKPAWTTYPLIRQERIEDTPCPSGVEYRVTNGRKFAGVDDFRSKGMAPGHGQDIASAVKGRDPSRALVLLAHQPRAIFDAAKHDVGLMLRGHTHGGQIWPIQHISTLVNTYVKGLHKHGRTWIYVSSGTGFWGPPLRLASTAEISLITLEVSS